MRLSRIEPTVYVLSATEDKIVLVFGDKPIAAIFGRVLFLRRDMGENHTDVIRILARFINSHKGLFYTTVINRKLIDGITISV